MFKWMPNLLSKMSKKILIESIHDSKTPFDCSICDIDFSLKCTLRKHVKQIHENKSQHTCLICGHNYSLKCTLKNHIGSVHENKAQKCSIWCQTYSLKCTLKFSLDKFMIAKHHVIAQFVTLILVSNVL